MKPLFREGERVVTLDEKHGSVHEVIVRPMEIVYAVRLDQGQDHICLEAELRPAAS